MATLRAKYGTEEEVNLGSTTGITAVVGGQAAATQLTKKWSEITVNPVGGAVKLAAMKIGSRQAGYNNTLNDLIIYPTVGEAINGVTNYAFVVAAGGFFSFESPKNAVSFSYIGSL